MGQFKSEGNYDLNPIWFESLVNRSKFKMKHFVLIFVIGYYGFSTQFTHGQGVGARLGRALGTALDDVTEPGVEERLIALRDNITILQEQMKMVYWHLNIDERDDPSQSLAHSGFGRRNEHEDGYGHNQTGVCTPEGDECIQGVLKRHCCEGLFCKRGILILMIMELDAQDYARE